jgi:TRAP-type uncharacterized transport system fused permease subunit
MTVFHLYAAVATITTQMMRGIHVGMVLFLSFLVFPITPKMRGKLAWYDILLSLLSVSTIVYMLWDFEDFIYRAVTPETPDMILGTILMVLVLEAARRSAGWIMPAVVLGFLAYAFAGPWLPAPWTHRGYDLERIVGHMYMTLEGIFGVPIDVSSTTSSSSPSSARCWTSPARASSTSTSPSPSWAARPRPPAAP